MEVILLNEEIVSQVRNDIELLKKSKGSQIKDRILRYEAMKKINKMSEKADNEIDRVVSNINSIETDNSSIKELNSKLKRLETEVITSMMLRNSVFKKLVKKSS